MHVSRKVIDKENKNYTNIGSRLFLIKLCLIKPKLCVIVYDTDNNDDA